MHTPVDSGFFSGPDRIEYSPLFGRPMRMGNPAELKVSDVEMVRRAIEAGDASNALARVELLIAVNSAVTGTFLEWNLALPAELSQHVDASMEEAVRTSAVCLWQNDAVSAPLEARRILEAIFCPAELNPAVVTQVRTLREAKEKTVIDSFLQYPTELGELLCSKIRAGLRQEALRAWEEYITAIRARHDLCGLFVSAYAAAVASLQNEKLAVELTQEALESCGLLDEMWRLVAELPPVAVAAMMAEHLRAHFSGPGREGSVEVVEEEDRYRLIFAPCGTGGALRQHSFKSLRICNDPQPATWHRSGEVPTYCAHCAMNEITSIQLIGYPAWVTEFSPDPHKPCGWTVYKRRELIPAEYYQRLWQQLES